MGSNIGSSRSSAGVSGTLETSTPSYGIASTFCNAAMARSGSPICAATRADRMPAGRRLNRNRDTRFRLPKYCSDTGVNSENCGSQTLRSGERLNSFLPFGSFEPFTGPATLQIILKNNTKCSFSEACCDMFSQRFHIFIVQSLLVLSQFRIREIMWCHLRWIESLSLWRSFSS